MKHRFIVPVLILTFAAASCDKWELLNPVDPDAPNYIGIPSADRDGDGIGQYADVDDIVLEAPEDGASVSDGDSLIIRTFRPGLARAYRIQIFTDETDPDTSIVSDKDDYLDNECPLPSLGQSSIYYWRAKAFDGVKWSDNWSPVRSFSISYSGGINIDTDMDEPFNVTLSGSTAVSPGNPVSVTVSSSASVDDYRWYLNGEELSGESGSRLTLSRDWEEGRHTITLIARAGEVYASADFVFEVSGVPAEGLLAYYPFDGNADDASGNGHDGNVYGPSLSADRLGNQNSAYEFDGNNDYIDIGDKILFGDGFAFSIWFKSYHTDSSYHGLIGDPSRNNSNRRSPGIWIVQKTQIHAGFSDGTWKNFTTSNIFNANEWTHLVVQYDADTSYDVYINGFLEYTSKQFASRSIYQTPVKYIGMSEYDFSGKMDDIRIYSRALTPDEIELLYKE